MDHFDARRLVHPKAACASMSETRAQHAARPALVRLGPTGPAAGGASPPPGRRSPAWPPSRSEPGRRAARSAKARVASRPPRSAAANRRCCPIVPGARCGRAGADRGDGHHDPSSPASRPARSGRGATLACDWTADISREIHRPDHPGGGPRQQPGARQGGRGRRSHAGGHRRARLDAAGDGGHLEPRLAKAIDVATPPPSPKKKKTPTPAEAAPRRGEPSPRRPNA